MSRGQCFVWACMLASVWIVLGCSAEGAQTGWIVTPGMIRSVPIDPYDPSPLPSLTKVGALRAPPPNTVPLNDAVFPYAATEEDAERAGKELTNPFEASPENLRRGQKVFLTFCTPCHGSGGLGNGRAFPTRAVPGLFDRAMLLGDGHLFHIITHGQDVMPSYAHAISADDRWRVVLYVRTLQRSVSSLEQTP